MSSNRTVQVSTGGNGFFLLFLVFLVLKLTDYIDWSWWWVTAPLWGPVVLSLAFFGLFALGALFLALLGAVFKPIGRKRRRKQQPVGPPRLTRR